MPEENKGAPAAEMTIAQLRAALAADPEETPTPTPQEEASPATPAAADAAEASGAEPAPASEPEVLKEPDTVPPGVQKRIDKAIAKQREAERRAEEAERKLLEAQGTDPAPNQTDRARTSEPNLPEGKPKAENFSDYEAFIEALTDWKVDQKESQKAQQSAAEALNSAWTERARKALAANPDFQEAINTVGPFLTKAGVADLIKESPHGTEIIQHLFDHQDEGLRIAKLGHPQAIAREIGRLEARFSAQTPPPPAAAAAAAKPLPKPPVTVGGGGTPAEVDLNSCDQRTFNREMKKRLAP